MASTKKKVTANNFGVDLTALHAENSKRFVESAKPRATSLKRQAGKETSDKQQAQSNKPQATSHKQQAT